MLLLESLGWIIATTLLFVAATRPSASRRLVIDIAIGVVLTGLAFVVFNYGLGLDPARSARCIEQLLPAERRRSRHRRPRAMETLAALGHGFAVALTPLQPVLVARSA